MSRYFVGILACLVYGFAYPALRHEVISDLEASGIRTRDIRQKLKGSKNFWLYMELEAAYDLGPYGKLLRLYTVLVCAVSAFHISLGWIPILHTVDLAAFLIVNLLLSVMIFYTCLRRNRRLFGGGFVLFGKQVRKDRKGKVFEKNYYSTVFDLILTAFPWVFPWMVWWLGRIGE